MLKEFGIFSCFSCCIAEIMQRIWQHNETKQLACFKIYKVADGKIALALDAEN